MADPWFYVAAVPAVLLMGISKSGFGAGFGALATPLMALTIPVPQAAAIMLPLLAVMDGLGFLALIRHADRGLLRLLLPAGLLWLSDQPGPPGRLVLGMGESAGAPVLRITRLAGSPANEKADSLREPAYRRLGLAELQVLARSEGLDLQQEDGPPLSLVLALPA